MVYNFYHITDVYYYSKRNFKCDWHTFPQPSTQICILKSEEAFKKALEIIEADEDTSTVIITGDLTNHGETYSHEEVKDILQEFTDKGGNLFVYTDNHDYPYFPIYGYDKNREKLPMEPLPEDEVKKIVEDTKHYKCLKGYYVWDEPWFDYDLNAAREALINTLSNYQGVKKCHLILVFDA